MDDELLDDAPDIPTPENSYENYYSQLYEGDDELVVGQDENNLNIYLNDYNTTMIYEYYDGDDNLFLVKDKQFLGQTNKANIESIVNYCLTDEFLKQSITDIEKNEDKLVLHAIHSYCDYRKNTAIIYVQFKITAKEDGG